MGKRHISIDRTNDDALDSAAFARQFCAVHKRLWLLATGLVGDRTQADDIVQEATLIAWCKLTEFQPGTNFAAWLAEIVRRCAMNHLRKQRTRNTLPTDPNSMDQLGVSPAVAQPPTIESGGDLSEYQSHFDDEILHALGTLSPEARCCLLLRVVHQLSYAEISEFLQLPEGTAMSHVHRTKSAMRQQLQSLRRDTESHPKP